MIVIGLIVVALVGYYVYQLLRDSDIDLSDE